MRPAPSGAPIVAPITKVCSFCWTEITDPEWRELPRVGLMDDGDGGWLELRNHLCGTTLAVEVSP